jgi:hypothetical protein
MRCAGTEGFGLKRALLFFVASFLGLVVILYFWSVAIVAAIVAPLIEARGGQLSLESIRLRAAGLELRVAHYAEGNVSLSGLRVFCPWGQLGALDEGFAGRVHVDKLQFRIDVSQPVEPSEPLRPEAQAAELVDLFDALPLRSLQLTVDELALVAGEQVWRYGFAADLLQADSGELHLSLSGEGTGLVVDGDLSLLAEGAGLALDFSLSASQWDAFQDNYLRTFVDKWSAAGMELYVDPLGSERGFLDVSGYVRWSKSAADSLSYAVLADFGAGEVYLPQGELLLQNFSGGWASDGVGHSRAYVKGAVDSVRVGSWMVSDGDWALRLDGAKLSAELRLGEVLSFSLEHDDWQRLFDGAGTARFYCETSAVNAELLRAFELPELLELPAGLELDLAARVEGEGTLVDWQLQQAKMDIDANIQRVVFGDSGISLGPAEGQAHLTVSAAELSLAELELAVERVDALGFVMSQVQTALSWDESGILSLQPLTANAMGGQLRIGAMQFDPRRLDDFSFRARLDSVDLSQLAAAVPQFQGEVTGSVSGYLVGSMRAGQPVLTGGRLEVDGDSGARLRYNVNGLLTQGLSRDSSAYKQYRMAELAFQDLALQHFSIDVFPGGNATRPFQLEIFGESLQDRIIVPVDFTLNVNVDDTAGLLELLRMIQRGELDLN